METNGNKKTPLKFSLIIPAFNEAARLPLFLEQTRAYLKEKYPGSHEIIVVNDGSRDETQTVAEVMIGKPNVLHFPENRGKGAAVRAGMLAACGEWRFFADADGATPIAEEVRLVHAIKAGNDIAIGSRAAAGGIHKWEWWGKGMAADSSTPNPAVWHVRPHRHFVGRVFSTMVKRFTGLDYADTQCGFKLFRAEAAHAIFSATKVDRFAFDVELLYLAKRFGYRVAEVPVNWHEVAGSKVSLVRDSFSMLQEILKLQNLHSATKKTSVAESARGKRLG